MPELMLQGAEFGHISRNTAAQTFNFFTRRSISSSSDETNSNAPEADLSICSACAALGAGGAIPLAWSIADSKSDDWKNNLKW